MVRSIGCELSFWKPNPDNWKFDVDDLKKLIRKNTRMIIINFPHNPTGSYLTPDEQLGIVKIARDHGAYIFSDEMYRGLELSKDFQTESLADMYEKTISLRGFSKTIGLPGLRFGWLTLPDGPLYQEIMNWKNYTSMCSNQVNEYLGLMAINAYDKIATKRESAKVHNDNVVLPAVLEKKLSCSTTNQRRGAVQIATICKSIGDTTMRRFLRHRSFQHTL